MRLKIIQFFGPVSYSVPPCDGGSCHDTGKFRAAPSDLVKEGEIGVPFQVDSTIFTSICAGLTKESSRREVYVDVAVCLTCRMLRIDTTDKASDRMSLQYSLCVPDIVWGTRLSCENTRSFVLLIRNGRVENNARLPMFSQGLWRQQRQQ